MDNTILLLAAIAVIVITAILGARYYLKEIYNLAIFYYFLLALAVIILLSVREKESQGKPVKAEALSPKVKWETLGVVPLNSQFCAVLKNMASGEIVVAVFKEKPPAKFQIENRGWWRWKKSKLIPLEQESPLTGKEETN